MEREQEYSGGHIAREIQQKNEEMRELSQAMDELDRGSLPWNLLNKEYEARKAEWQKLNNTRYMIKL